ncbi:branched-chain amino acid ABC transporter permease [Aggregatilinea sp.]
MYFGLRIWQRSKAAAELNAQPSRRLLKSIKPYPSNGTSALLILIAVAASAVAGIILDRTGVYDKVFHGTSPFLIGLIVGFFVAGIAGIMLGIPVLRLRGDYLAIVTLGFGEIIRLLFTNLRDFTGGPQGILQIPRPLPDDAKGSITYLALVYLVLIGAAFVAFFSTRLKASRIGRAWNAMRSDETIAQSMGVNLVQTKLMAFAIGAAFAGIGGVLFAARQRNIYPADFDLNVSITVLSLVIIGGMGSIPGVIMGAIVLIGIPEMLRELATYRILAFGALLVAIVIIRPEGLLPAPPTQLGERARQLVGARKESES